MYTIDGKTNFKKILKIWLVEDELYFHFNFRDYNT